MGRGVQSPLPLIRIGTTFLFKTIPRELFPHSSAFFRVDPTPGVHEENLLYPGSYTVQDCMINNNRQEHSLLRESCTKEKAIRSS